MRTMVIFFGIWLIFSISFVSILFAAHVNIQVKEGSIKMILKKINNDHFFVSELYIFLHYQFFGS